MRQGLVVDNVDRPLGRQHLLDGLQLDLATGGGGGEGGGGGGGEKRGERVGWGCFGAGKGIVKIY